MHTHVLPYFCLCSCDDVLSLTLPLAGFHDCLFSFWCLCFSLLSVARDCVEPSRGLTCFSQRFAQRYGSLHPLFYIGSLADAVNEATGGPVAKVRGGREREKEREREREDGPDVTGLAVT